MMTDLTLARRSVPLRHVIRGVIAYATLAGFHPAMASAQAVSDESEETRAAPVEAPTESQTASPPTTADAPPPRTEAVPAEADRSQDAAAVAAPAPADAQAEDTESGPALADSASAPPPGSMPSAPVPSAPVAGAPSGTTPAPAGTGTAPAGSYPMLDQPQPEPPQGPVTQTFQLAFGLDTLFYKDRGYDAFSDTDAAGRGSITLSYALWLSDALSIAPEVAYVGEGTTGGSLLGGNLASTEFDAHGATAGASVRYELWGFLAPHARLAGGLSWTRAKLQFVGDEDPDVNSSAWLPSVTLGAGFSVMTPDRALQTRSGKLASLALGLLFEGGYVLSSPLAVDLADSELEGRVATDVSPLGEVSRSAPYFRAALFGRL